MEGLDSNKYMLSQVVPCEYRFDAISKFYSRLGDYRKFFIPLLAEFCSHTTNTLVYINPFMVGCVTLKQWLESASTVSEKDARMICESLLNIVAALYTLPHGNLHADNVFVCEDDKCVFVGPFASNPSSSPDKIEYILMEFYLANPTLDFIVRLIECIITGGNPRVYPPSENEKYTYDSTYKLVCNAVKKRGEITIYPPAIKAQKKGIIKSAIQLIFSRLI